MPFYLHGSCRAKCSLRVSTYKVFVKQTLLVKRTDLYMSVEWFFKDRKRWSDSLLYCRNQANESWSFLGVQFIDLSLKQVLLRENSCCIFQPVYKEISIAVHYNNLFVFVSEKHQGVNLTLLTASHTPKPHNVVTPVIKRNRWTSIDWPRELHTCSSEVYLYCWAHNTIN